MSYSTALGLRYLLASLLHLDEEYQGEGTYAPDGNEGPWYVAGWTGRDGLKLSRVRERALVGVWEYCAAAQRVLGSEAWERCQREERERYPHLPARGITYARVTGLEPTIDAPGMLVAYLDRESWGSGEYDDYRPGETLENLLRVNPHAGTLRKEWALTGRSLPHELGPYYPLVADLPYHMKVRDGRELLWVLWIRYVRRGVAEPWHVHDTARTEDEALGMIDRAAGLVCVCGRLQELRQVEREGADFELLRAQEAREREEAGERKRRHEHASNEAFRRLLEGKDAGGRELARRWQATIRELSKPEHEGLRGRLRKNQGHMRRYEAVMEAERVPAKRRAVREWLEWVELEVGMRVEADPEQAKEAR